MESNHPVLPGSADRRSSEDMDFVHASAEDAGHLLFIFLYDSPVPIRQKFNGAARGYLLSFRTWMGIHTRPLSSFISFSPSVFWGVTCVVRR